MSNFFRNDIAIINSLEMRPSSLSSSLSIVTTGGEAIDINGDSFSTNNASFAYGTIIPGVPDASHVVFGANDGPRYITTTEPYNLKKGTYISLSVVAGEAYGGSIELPEDPDENEDIVIEVSTDGTTFIALPGRITPNNASNTEYRTFRFQMTHDDNSYYIRIKQTNASGSGYDYYGIKDLEYNLNTILRDTSNNILIFL